MGWRPFVAMGIVLSVALAARVWRLGDVNYWFDETFTIRMSEFPWGEIVARSAADNHPPLSFFAQKLWNGVFGTSELATRSLSAAWSLGVVVASAGLAWETMRRADGTPNGRGWFAAALTGLLVGLSPLHLHWAQQTRMYAPACFFAVLSTWLLARALNSDGGFRGWLAYALATMCGLYTHTFVALVVAGQGAGLALCGMLALAGRLASRPKLSRGWTAMGAAVVVWGPWMVAVFDQARRVRREFWSPPFETRLIGESIAHAFCVVERTPPDSMYGLVLAQILGVVALGLVATRRAAGVVLAGSFVAPIALVVAASMWGQNLMYAKYLYFGQTHVLTAAGVMAAAIPWSLPRVVVACGLVAASAWGTLDYHSWRKAAASKPGLPELLRVWRSERGEGEVLVFCNPMFYTTARVYSGRSEPFVVQGRLSDYPFYLGTAITRPEDYASLTEWTRDGRSDGFWACDFGLATHYLKPVQVPAGWALAGETAIEEFNGRFYLRYYKKQSDRLVE